MTARIDCSLGFGGRSSVDSMSSFPPALVSGATGDAVVGGLKVRVAEPCAKCSLPPHRLQVMRGLRVRPGWRRGQLNTLASIQRKPRGFGCAPAAPGKLGLFCALCATSSRPCCMCRRSTNITPHGSSMLFKGLAASSNVRSLLNHCVSGYGECQQATV